MTDRQDWSADDPPAGDDTSASAWWATPKPEFQLETFDLHAGAPEPVALPPPELPGYRVEAQLGEGAMGQVFRALDLKRGHPVALKVSTSTAPEEQARIAHEAELQGQLHHPAVPRILRVGRLPDGRAYLVQSLVRDARTLDDAAADASWVEKVEWIATAAEALAIAHGRCVVHGDLKPDNLLVDGRGRLAVIDWGVSRLGECAAPAPAELSASMRDYARRHASWVFGTLAYMPPEQLRGKPEAASDVFALAIVLLEALIGRHPRAEFMDDAERLIQEVLTGPPPGVPDGLPDPLPVLLRRCLHPNPARRPPSVEVARVLRRLARAERRASALAGPERVAQGASGRDG